MPIVNESAHLGIMRSTSLGNTQKATSERNITKARRAAYSLMSVGMHGENGIDPITAIQLYKTFVQPTLTFGLGVIIPESSNMLQLDKFQKQLIKRILSLPINAPDPCAYLLSGLLPIEAQLDLKILTLYHNICRQQESSVEKRIGRRQLMLKSENSNSWFITLRNIVFKYELPSSVELLDNPPNKNAWKRTLQTTINQYWKHKLINDAESYISLWENL